MTSKTSAANAANGGSATSATTTGGSATSATSPSATAPLAEGSLAFVGALFGRAPGGSTIELRPFAPAWADQGAKKLAPKWRLWRDVADVRGLVQYGSRAALAGLDVYVGVTARRARGGTAADVVAATCLWAELDGSQSGKGHGCQSKHEAWQRLASCPVPPSIIVDSGGGYHAYWLLEEPVVDRDALRQVPVWNARIRELLRDDRGYAGDDVGDLARILRMPGTSNRKRHDEVRPVVLVHCDPDSVYSLDYLDSVLPALPARAWTDGATSSAAGAIAGDRQPEMHADPERRARLVQDAGLAWSQSEGVRHFLPLPMARVLLSAGWPWQDIPDLIHDIAASGGSADAGARAATARAELGGASADAGGRKDRAGWPWLRQNAAVMADALTRALDVDADDIRDVARALSAAVAVDMVRHDDPVMAPAPAMAYTPGSIAAGPWPIAAPTPAPEPVSLHSIRGGKGAEAPAKPDAERAAERLYNLLRLHLDWVGVAQDDNRPYAGRIRPTAHGHVVETVPLDGKECKLWALEMARNAGLPLTESHRTTALELLAAEARHHVVALSLRFAADDGAWMIDLGTSTWDRVRIDAGQWTIEDGEGPMFTRTPCTLPYVAPEPLAQPGDLVDGLVEVLHCDVDVAAQLGCWMVQALHPTAPRMGLFVTGPQGSGKSTFARIARQVVDPARPPLIKFSIQKGKEADYAQAAVHKAMLGTLAYSNVSSMNEATSDLLCGLLTGDGDIRRQLFTDTDAVISDGRRNLVLEGITVVGMGADLQDRLLHVTLPVRTSFEPEAAMDQRLDLWMPKMVGGLFAAAADALSRLDSIEAQHQPMLDRCRMRDAAAIYGAAAAAFGLDAGDMLARLVGDRNEAQGDEAESDIVGQRVLAFVERQRAFTVGDMVFSNSLDRLSLALQAVDGGQAPDGWPKSLRALRAKLDRLLPGLRSRGIEVVFYRSKGLDRKASVDVRLIPTDTQAA